MNNSIFLGWLCSASSASRVHVRATSMRMACTLAFGARSTICRQSAARCLHSLGVIIVRPRAVFCDVQGSADACAYSSQRLQFRSRVAARSRREALFCRSHSPWPTKSSVLRKLLSGVAGSERDREVPPRFHWNFGGLEGKLREWVERSETTAARRFGSRQAVAMRLKYTRRALLWDRAPPRRQCVLDARFRGHDNRGLFSVIPAERAQRSESRNPVDAAARCCRIIVMPRRQCVLDAAFAGMTIAGAKRVSSGVLRHSGRASAAKREPESSITNERPAGGRASSK
jgi:hypothetical protein